MSQEDAAGAVATPVRRPRGIGPPNGTRRRERATPAELADLAGEPAVMRAVAVGEAEVAVEMAGVEADVPRAVHGTFAARLDLRRRCEKRGTAGENGRKGQRHDSGANPPSYLAHGRLRWGLRAPWVDTTYTTICRADRLGVHRALPAKLGTESRVSPRTGGTPCASREPACTRAANGGDSAGIESAEDALRPASRNVAGDRNAKLQVRLDSPPDLYTQYVRQIPRPALARIKESRESRAGRWTPSRESGSPACGPRPRGAGSRCRRRSPECSNTCRG